MRHITYKLSIVTIILTLIVFSSCVKQDFDNPTSQTIPTGTSLTISDLRQIFMDSVMSGIYPEGYKFTEDYSVYCVCTMDDKSGNIYKSSYVQDATDAVNLHMLSSGGLYEGDSIRINLKGLIVGDYENMLQIDSVHVDNCIVKIATERDIEPEVVTIEQILTGNYQAKLIKLEDVKFKESEWGSTWADAEGLETESHTIEDGNGLTMIVRTSGYADFAGKALPQGTGSLVAIVGQFRDDWQLSIRRLSEVDMDPPIIVYEQNFDAVVNGEILNLEGWKNIAVQGTSLWKGINTTTLTSVNLKPTNDIVQETWLISSEIALPEDESPFLNFETNANKDRGGVLTVFVSTDYDGGDDPSSATWTELPATICDAPLSEFGTWTNSGSVSLADYTGSIRIAFKYEGTDVNNTEYYIDSFFIAY